MRGVAEEVDRLGGVVARCGGRGRGAGGGAVATTGRRRQVRRHRKHNHSSGGPKLLPAPIAPAHAVDPHRSLEGGKYHLPSRIGKKLPSSTPTSDAMRSFVTVFRATSLSPFLTGSLARLFISSGS